MSSRFSAGLSKIREEAGIKTPAAPPPTAAEAPHIVISEAKAAPRQKSRDGKVSIAGWFHPQVRKQLAMLAVEQDKDQVELLAEALNLLFEKNGRSPIAKA